MSLHSWLRSLRARIALPNTARRLQSDAPRVMQLAEVLEPRCLLAVTPILINSTELQVQLESSDDVSIQSDPTGKLQVLSSGSVVIGNPDILTADITSITVNGGDGSNRIDLTAVTTADFAANLPITVNGGDGNDTILGSEFADMLIGGNGADSITGGLENDTLDGSNGNDTIDGGVGDDSILGGDGADSIHGDTGDDTVNAGDGADHVFGDDGVDLLNGGDGSDTLEGDLGNDTLNGDSGSDSLLGGDDDDLINGGAGNDVASGGDGIDVINGDADNDSLSGDDGTDVLDGGDGKDTLLGGNANDTINGGLGNDSVQGNDGNDSIFGGGGNDSIVGGLGDDTAFGQAGNDTMVGGGGVDSLDGGAGNDQIFGQSTAVGLLINDVTISEGDVGTVNATFTVGLTIVSTQTVTVAYATSGGTAISGTDFSATSGTLTFQPGVTSQTLVVPIIGDTTPEAPETFFVTLSNAVNATISDNQGQVTITDADVPVGATLTPSVPVNASRLRGDQSETTIAVSPFDPLNVIAAANDISGNAGGDPIWYSTNGGLSFTQVTIPLPAGQTVSFGDPTLAFDRAGNAYYAHLTAASAPALGQNPVLNLCIAKSTDKGASWTPYVALNTGDVDKEIMTIGPDPVNPAQDNVYIATRRDVGNDTQIHLLASYDGGVTFPTDTLINDDSIIGDDFSSFPVPAVGPNGKLYVVWDDFTNRPNFSEIKLDSSTDGGRTFGTDQLVGTTRVARGNPAGQPRYIIPAQPDRAILSVPSIGVATTGPNAGRLFVSYTDAPFAGSADTNVVVGFSDDTNGAAGSWTFTNPSDDRTNTSQFWSWVAVDPLTGVPSVSWYDARNDVANNRRVDVYFSTSIDNGVTWQPNVRVSRGQSDQSVANPNADANNYGDYKTLAVYNNVAYVVWADNSATLPNNPDGTSALDIAVAAVTIAVTTSGGPGGVSVGTTLPSTTDVGDTLIGGEGNDTVIGGDGNDLINGMAGNDSLVGGAGNDSLLGGAGADTIDGQAGDDVLNGQGGNDVVSGGDGQDTYVWNGMGDGVDYLSSLSGYDKVRVQGTAAANNYVVSQANGQLRITDGTAVLNVSPVIQIVDILAGDGNDTITIGALDRVRTATLLTVNGGDGNDAINMNGANNGLLRLSLIGGTGDDSLTGSSGNDTLDGGDGDDRLDGQGGNDQIGGGLGDDTILGGAGNDRIAAGDGSDSIDAGTGDDSVSGDVGADTINGVDGNDTLDGGDGNDSINGGAGNDSILGGNEADNLNGSTGNDTIRGGANDDTIVGENGNDKLYGDDGNDSIQGYDGDDTINGGDGDDTLDGMVGNDLIAGGNGDDILNGAAGNDILTGDDGSDTIAGGAGADVLLGGEGDDSLNGQGGSDTINPGEGNDIIVDLVITEIDTTFTLSTALLAALA